MFSALSISSLSLSCCSPFSVEYYHIEKSIYNYKKLAGQLSDILPVYQPIACACSIFIVNFSKHAVMSLPRILWHSETPKLKLNL